VVASKKPEISAFDFSYEIASYSALDLQSVLIAPESDRKQYLKVDPMIVIRVVI
jgi:hypothetical protein